MLNELKFFTEGDEKTMLVSVHMAQQTAVKHSLRWKSKTKLFTNKAKKKKQKQKQICESHLKYKQL